VSDWDELITESRKLDETASQIQQGETVGLTKEEIDSLSSRYHLWYERCLALLPEDLKQKFRSEYGGSWHSPKIKKFLAASTKPYPLRPNDKQGKAIWSYWAYPYEKTFAPCIHRQRQILIEVKASRPNFSIPKGAFSTEEADKVTSLAQQYPYDVAISFAGEDRIHAEALADALRRRKINVFYDKYEKTTLWGKDLYTHLSDLYQNKARYCVMFFSQHYVAKAWTKHELKAAQARALNENKEYILPIRLDSTEIPGILQTTAYLDWHEETTESVAEALLEKLGEVPQVLLISERIIMDWLIDEALLSSGRVGVDFGDVPGVKHFMSMEKDNEDWEAWYGMWFQQAFTERMGFEPTEESVEYALEKYAEIAE